MKARDIDFRVFSSTITRSPKERFIEWCDENPSVDILAINEVYYPQSVESKVTVYFDKTTIVEKHGKPNNEN